MQQSIYVDILLAINFIIDYFLLRLTAILTGRKANGKRLILTALLASLTSLMIFLPALQAWINVLINLLLSALISFIAFGYSSRYGLLLQTTAFYGVNLIYAGGMLWFCRTFHPDGILFYHGALYFQLSPILLIGWASALYFGVKLFHFSLKSGRIIGKSVYILLTYGKNTIRLKGFTDTGNHAYDPYTGKPVIFCTATALKPIIGSSGVEWFRQRSWLTDEHVPADLRIRLLPLRFVGGESVLPVFLPHKLEAEINGKYKTIDAAVAVTEQLFREGYDLLLHPELTEQNDRSSFTTERQGIQ